jgi:hypothetical protein
MVDGTDEVFAGDHFFYLDGTSLSVPSAAMEWFGSRGKKANMYKPFFVRPQIPVEPPDFSREQWKWFAELWSLGKAKLCSARFFNCTPGLSHECWVQLDGRHVGLTPGSGYIAHVAGADTPTLTQGNGTGMRVRIREVGAAGGVVCFEVTHAGDNYEWGDEIQINHPGGGPGGGGAPAQATFRVSWWIANGNLGDPTTGPPKTWSRDSSEPLAVLHAHYFGTFAAPEFKRVQHVNIRWSLGERVPQRYCHFLGRSSARIGDDGHNLTGRDPRCHPHPGALGAGWAPVFKTKLDVRTWTIGAAKDPKLMTKNEKKMLLQNFRDEAVRCQLFNHPNPANLDGCDLEFGDLDNDGVDGFLVTIVMPFGAHQLTRGPNCYQQMLKPGSKDSVGFVGCRARCVGQSKHRAASAGWHFTDLSEKMPPFPPPPATPAAPAEIPYPDGEVVLQVSLEDAEVVRNILVKVEHGRRATKKLALGNLSAAHVDACHAIQTAEANCAAAVAGSQQALDAQMELLAAEEEFAKVERDSMLKLRRGKRPQEVPFSVGTFAFEVYEQLDYAPL